MVLWLLIPMAAIVLLNTGMTYRDAQLTARIITDRTLLASARSIAEQIRVDDGVLDVSLPPAALGMFESEHRDFVYYGVSGPYGELLDGIPDLPTPREPVTGLEPRYSDAHFRGNDIRLVSVSQPLPLGGGARAAQVTVGQTLHGCEALAAELWTRNLKQQMLLVLLATLTAWLGLQRGLQPLLRLRDQVVVRKPNELQQLSVSSVHSEMQPLVLALNEYMQRLQRQLAARRNFHANAAHQLRTPIALLRTQADYALRETGDAEKDGALRGILATAKRMTRLTNQLLALSRAESEGHTYRQERVDLPAVARRVLEETAGLALAREIDLGLEDAGAPIVACADPTMMHELLVNLVDNALRYTHVGGMVTVTVGRDDGRPFVTVQDNGPGIPAAERERVFERFYRMLGVEADGSGLGLAIVKEIVCACGGSVSLGEPAEGSGLVVAVRLPAGT